MVTARRKIGPKPSAVYANRMQRYPDTVWLIWSNKWGCWYRSDCSGYTNDIAQAGLYDRAKAAAHYDGPVPKKYRDTEPFPLSAVQAHIQRRIDEVKRELAEKQALLAHMSALTSVEPGQPQSTPFAPGPPPVASAPATFPSPTPAGARDLEVTL